VKVSSLVRMLSIGVALFAMTVPVAQASLISGVLPGLVSTSDKPATCDTSASQPFARFGDNANYVLAPGGSFESGTLGWQLNGASVVSGNEPYYVHGNKDKHSLSIPAGGSATTPPMCFAPGDWHLRFFAQSSSSSFSSMRVNVKVKSALGLLSILDGGTVSANGTWAPSPRLGLLLTNVTSILAVDSVSFQFVPNDRASWRIDDVYLDPWKTG
jgi:hypothetical protein